MKLNWSLYKRCGWCGGEQHEPCRNDDETVATKPCVNRPGGVIEVVTDLSAAFDAMAAAFDRHPRADTIVIDPVWYARLRRLGLITARGRVCDVMQRAKREVRRRRRLLHAADVLPHGDRRVMAALTADYASDIPRAEVAYDASPRVVRYNHRALVVGKREPTTGPVVVRLTNDEAVPR